MKKVTFILMIFMALIIGSCGGVKKTSNENTVVKISTDYGDITIKLYDETPKHRDNFIKLIQEGWYDGSTFHRVINEFMIQGGGSAKGGDDPGYTVEAEILPQLFHKKGVLAAARRGDNVNPDRASSSSQFYIVQGRKFIDSEFEALENRNIDNENVAVQYRIKMPISEEQREVYRTIGGTPHLDGAYTVFGEVIEGLDVVDKIAAVETGQYDKPVKDIKMTIKIIR